MRCFVTRSAAVSVTLVVAVGLAVGGCGSTGRPAAAGCLSKGGQSAAPGAAADSNSLPSQTPFQKISGDFAIADERFASHRIHIDAPSGIVDLQGTLGFGGAISYVGQLSFPSGAAPSTSAATDGIAGFLGEILRNAAGKLAVPFALKGTLAQPQVLPAQAASARR